MPRSHVILLAAALLCPATALSQHHDAPRKRTTAIAPGMTPAQVRQVLGEPVRVRHEGALTYLEYANGCPGCTNDYVVVENCRVVAARFENPSRQLLTTPAPDTSTPPEEECRASAADQPPAAVAMAPAAPAAPTGVAPASAMAVADTSQPAAGAAQQQAVATVPEPAMQDGSAREWRSRLSLRRPVTHLIAVPGASLSSPTAFGVQFREAFVGVSYQQRTRFTDTDDGAVAIGFGLGDRKLLALETTVSSYSTIRGGGPFETGGLNFKLHHAFGDTWGVAAGWENAINWGGSDAGNSPFGVVTHIVRLRPDPSAPLSAVALSGGVGAGRFRREKDVLDENSTVNVFGSVGVQVLEQLSAIADWNGQDLFAGVSIAPIRRVPMLINAGFADITGSAGDGARFVISAGMGFRYLPPFF